MGDAFQSRTTSLDRKRKVTRKEKVENILSYRATVDKILAHRYLYYILNEPVISDAEYDALEQSLPAKQRNALGVGSSLSESYSEETKRLANFLSTFAPKETKR